jgi:hypothetical protein
LSRVIVVLLSTFGSCRHSSQLRLNAHQRRVMLHEADHSVAPVPNAVKLHARRVFRRRGAARHGASKYSEMDGAATLAGGADGAPTLKVGTTNRFLRMLALIQK